MKKVIGKYKSNTKKIILITLFAFLVIFNFNFFLVKANEKNQTNKNEETDFALEERAGNNHGISDSIGIIDFNDLVKYPGKQDDRIIIFFDNNTGALKLKDGTNDMSQVKKLMFPYTPGDRPWHKKRQIDINDRKGQYVGLRWDTVDENHIVLYTNDPGKKYNGEEVPSGQYSGNLYIEYNKNKNRRNRILYNLYVYYLKFNNSNNNIHEYIDEKLPSKEELLENIKIEIEAKNPSDKIEQEEMLNNLMSKHKKIKAFEIDNKRTNLEEDFDIETLPKGKNFKLILDLSNPSKIKTKDGKEQHIEYVVNVKLVDTKTPFKEEIKKEAEKTIEEIKKLNLTPIDKNNLIEEINTKVEEAVKKIDSESLKHKDIDPTPFKGTTEDKEKSKKAAEELRNNIKLPVLETSNTNLAIAKVTDAANTKIENIKNDGSLTDEEKKELIEKVNDALEKSKQKLKDQDNKKGLITETESDIETINNIKIEESEKSKNKLSNQVDTLAQDKKDQINSDKKLTQSEKNKLLEKVDEELNKAKEQVHSAQNEKDISDIQNRLTQKLSKIKHEGITDKEKAIQGITEYLQQQKTNIGNNKTLTQEEKDKQIKAIDDASKEAINNINVTDIDDTKPDTKPQLNDLIESGKKSISDAIKANPPMFKEQALNQINEKKEQLENKINSFSEDQQVTEKDKEYYKSKIDMVDTEFNHINTNHHTKDELDSKKELALKKIKAAEDIIDALVSKTNLIKNNNELTQKEKEEEIKKIREKANTALDEIKTKTNLNEVNTNQIVSQINSHQVNPQAKNQAINLINEEKTKKLQEINQKFIEKVITADEKKKYEDTVNNAANENIKKIQDAQDITDEELNQNKLDAINAIKDVKPLGIENIKNKLQEISNKKLKEIEDSKEYIDTEKDNLKKDISDKLKEITDDLTLEKIKEKNPALDTDQLQAKINETIQKLNEKLDEVKLNTKTAKEKAIDDLNNYKEEKLREIEKISDENKKQEKKDLIEKAIETSISKINDQKDLNQESLNQLKQLEKDKIDTIEKLVDLKQKNEERVNNDNTLTQGEKNELLNQISTAFNEAKDNVIESTSSDNFSNIQTNLENTLKAINHVGGKKKDKAKEELEKIKTKKIADITDDETLIKEEKDKVIKAINDVYEEAKKKIEDTVIDDVNKPALKPQLQDLIDEGKNAIEKAITDNPGKNKPKAKEDINLKKNELKEKLSNLVNSKKITDEDKQYYDSKLDIADSVINDIDSNKLTNDQLENKKELALAKLTALDEIIDALVEKTNKIKENEALSADEKEKEINAIKEIANQQLNTIKNAQNIQEINAEQTVEEIKNHEVKPTDKQNAINEIESEKAKKINQIKEKYNSGIISESEKDKYIKDVNDASEKAILDIQSNPNISESDLNNYKTSGKTKINKVKPLGLDNIKQRLNDALNQKINEINGKKELVKSEKDKLIQELTDIRQTINGLTIDNILNGNDSSLDLEQLQLKLNQKETEISESIAAVKQTEQTLKEKTIETLKQHKDKKIQELENEQISEEEKQERINAINDSLNDSIRKIQEKENLDDDGLKSLEKLTITKMDLNDDIVSLKHLEKERINDDNTLIQSEKNKLLEKVDNEFNKAKEKVSISDKEDEISSLTDNLQNTLNSIDHEGKKQKEISKEEIDAYVLQKTNDINNDKSLTKEEKEKALEEVNNAAIKAKEDIDNAIIDDTNPETTPQLESLKEEAIKSIDEAILNNSSKFKPNALDEIEKKKTELTKYIQDLEKVNDEEKNYYLKQTQNLVDDIIESIKNKHLSNKDVNDKKSLALEKLNTANKIIEALAQKTKQIKENKELSANEKEKEIKAIKDIAEQKLQSIKNALNIQEVNAADTINNINNHQVTPNDKKQAISEIEAEKEKKLAEINKKAASGIISENEKNEYTNQVNNLATEAIKKINDDENILDSNLKKYKNDAINSISNIKPLGLDNLKAKLKELANQKINNINSQKELVESEKEKLIKKVNNIKDIIENLTIEKIIKNNDENLTTDSLQEIINEKEKELKTEIEKIKQTEKTAKEKARKQILDAYNKKVAEISNPKDKRFTKEEKNLQINDLNILKDKALDAIMISETNDDLNKVINEFINENTGLITTYNKEPHIKPLSLKALEEAKKKKEEEIMYSYQTDKGKDIALKQLNQLYTNYINDIKEADKNILVENHKEKAILLINGIKIINEDKDNSLLDKPIIKNIVNQNKKTKTKNRLYLYSIFLTPAAFMTIIFIIYKKRKNNNNK